jgi:hypothetical protein
MNRYFKKKAMRFRQIKFHKRFGGSMIETGLLIALALILFLMLVGIVMNIYDWIESQFNDVIAFFIPK